MAERSGFEPEVGFDPHTALARRGGARHGVGDRARVSAAACDTPGVGDPISWQVLVRARRRAAERWPSAFGLPLVHRPTDVVYSLLRGTERVLDVGAGDGERRRRVAARFPQVRYVSCDPDPESGADHARPGDAPGVFDVALLLEVAEHLRPEDAVALLAEVRGKLAPGGRVVVSVPAIHTPGRQFRDCTHVTAWSHDDLGAALILAGFGLESMHRSFPGTWLGRLARRAVLGPVGRVFGIDYAHSVVVVGVNVVDVNVGGDSAVDVSVVDGSVGGGDGGDGRRAGGDDERPA
ncbi:MAG: hypothetical protein HMLKMBBP_01274 [Planctomycetes bacterium]|nr:hypothetical protein [Planctomycetota bacterium]